MEKEPDDKGTTSRVTQSGQDMFAMAVNAAMSAKERAEGVMNTDVLENLGLPGPNDVKRLRTVAERSERIEETLAAIVERLDRIEAHLSGEAAAPAPRRAPRRSDGDAEASPTAD